MEKSTFSTPKILLPNQTFTSLMAQPEMSQWNLKRPTHEDTAGLYTLDQDDWTTHFYHKISKSLHGTSRDSPAKTKRSTMTYFFMNPWYSFYLKLGILSNLAINQSVRNIIFMNLMGVNYHLVADYPTDIS